MKEGQLSMSGKERRRMEVMVRVKGQGLKLMEAAKELEISHRQAKRIYRRYREEGDAGLVNRSRGKVSNRSVVSKKKESILECYRKEYSGFGPTFAAEKLSERNGHQVDHETLRRWLVKEGMWIRGRSRKKHRIRRVRKMHFGEMLQMDGSIHAWLPSTLDTQCIMNIVDDATGKTNPLVDTGETTFIAMMTLWNWITQYGIPRSIYVDQKKVFMNPKDKETGVRALTQWGLACEKLGIQVIAAYSPQAKGRVERSNGTHQDRLVKELRLRRISTLAEMNAYMSKTYAKEMNRKFAVTPLSEEDYHRPIPADIDLRNVFCLEYKRIVMNDWTVSYHQRVFHISSKNTPLPNPKATVILREWLDGSIHLFYNHIELIHLEQKPFYGTHILKEINQEKRRMRRKASRGFPSHLIYDTKSLPHAGSFLSS